MGLVGQLLIMQPVPWLFKFVFCLTNYSWTHPPHRGIYFCTFTFYFMLSEAALASSSREINPKNARKKEGAKVPDSTTVFTPLPTWPFFLYFINSPYLKERNIKKEQHFNFLFSFTIALEFVAVVFLDGSWLWIHTLIYHKQMAKPYVVSILTAAVLIPHFNVHFGVCMPS